MHRTVWIALLAIFLSVQFLNFSGFCYSAGRHYSNRDFIDAAVRYELLSQDETGKSSDNIIFVVSRFLSC